jgi:hypothetical protein
LPSAVTLSEAEADPCLVEWVNTQGPAVPPGCEPSAEDPIACPLLCAQPPECFQPRCEVGVCVLETSYEADDCEPRATECEELNITRVEALAEARRCLPNGIIAECGDDAQVPNECGCPVAVNSNQSLKVAAAQAAYDDWSAACSPPDKCQLVDCIQSTETSACVTGSSTDSICQWQ